MEKEVQPNAPESEQGERIFDPEISALLEQTEAVLETLGRDHKFAIEKQTKSQAPAYRLLEQANRASKEGIRYVRLHQWDAFRATVQENKQAFFDLSQVDLPADVLWQFNGDSGQEFAEFLQLAFLYPFLINDEKAVQFTPEEMSNFQKNYGFTTQQWLTGWCDALGELYKTMDPYEYNELKGNYAERLEQKIALNERLLAIQEMVFYNELDPSRCFPPRINSNSRRRGPGQTFQSKVYRVIGNMEKTKRAIANLADQLALFREQKSQISELKELVQKLLDSSVKIVPDRLHLGKKLNTL